MSLQIIDRITDTFFTNGSTPANGTVMRSIPLYSSGLAECWGVGRAVANATGLVYTKIGGAFRCFTNGLGVPTLAISQGSIVAMTGDLPVGETVSMVWVISGTSLFPQVTITPPEDNPPGYEFFVDMTFYFD